MVEDKKQPGIASFLKTLKCVQPKRQLSFNRILEGVKKKELYGFLIVDIHTPKNLKYYCRDFPPIVKNTDILKENIGSYMQKVAKKHELLNTPIKQLVVIL